MLNSDVFDALNNPGNANIIPGTKRITQVLQELGNPQHKYKVIHITGTNGKGSTAAFIETALCHAGYKVGKFSSPHIKVINECICLNRQIISDTDMESNFFQIQSICEKHNISLSPFELLTAIMFNYFATVSIDYLVLEVGMGGLDDATNVVDSIISIITNISLEHTKFLGSSLTEIAAHKTGIIKDGLTIIADNTPELIEAVSNKTQNYVNVLQSYNFTVDLDYDKFQTILRLSNISPGLVETYTLNLFGIFQAYNFLCAYHALWYLEINPASIKYAAENTMNPGRFEIRDHNPLLILDATHNLAGAECLAVILKNRFELEDVVIITSILADKDIEQMLRQFGTIAKNIICTTIANNPRAKTAEDLAHMAQKYFPQVLAIDDPSHALYVARSMNKKLILITGSLYLLSYFI
jgi:dihydrofolate synthase / folylpolyglutamate synthase